MDDLYAFDSLQERWKRRRLDVRKQIDLEHARSHVDRSGHGY